MAKQSNNRGGGGGKFRLIVFEGEIAEGGFSEFAQALQNAIRPAPMMQPRPSPPLLPNVGHSTPTGSTDGVSAEDVEAAEPDDTVVPPPPKSREQRQRRIVSPEVVADLDLNSDPSWMWFAEQVNPTTETDKYLTVAEWCKRHRGLSEISADHVFTCFKRVHWSTKKPDFALPLRSCKARSLMGSGSGRGLYIINHLGSSRVDEMLKK